MNLLVVTAVGDRSERSLYCALAQRGHRVVVVCHPNEPDNSQYETNGITVFRRSIPNRLSFGTAKFLRKLLRQYEIDAIYSPFNKGLASVTIASCGMPIKRFAYRGTLGNLSRWNPTAYLTHLSPTLTGIICNCHAVENSLRDFGLPSKKLFTIYKGHSAEWYRCEPFMDTKQFFQHRRPLISCLANLRALKGADVLLRALSLLEPDIRPNLLFIGKLEQRGLPSLVRQLGLSGYVHFLGYQPDAIRYISASDISIMPSLRREGVPRSIVESIFVGTPVIVSDVGGLPEIVEHQKGGLVVPKGNAPALAKAIRTLTEQPDVRQSYAEYALNKLTTMLRFDLYVDEIERTFALQQEHSRTKPLASIVHE